MYRSPSDEYLERRRRRKMWRVRAACAWLVCVAVGGLTTLIAVYGTTVLYPVLWTVGGVFTFVALLVALIEGIEWS